MTRENIFNLAAKAEETRFALQGAEGMLRRYVQLMIEEGDRGTEEYFALCGLNSMLVYILKDMQELQDALYEEARKAS